MSNPMPRPAVSSAASKAPASPASVTLAPPGPLDDLMAAAGFVAELVVRRADGKPMSEKDRAGAAWVVEQSEERDMTDEEATAIGRAELAAAQAAAQPRTKRAAAPTASKAARTAKRPAGRSSVAR